MYCFFKAVVALYHVNDVFRVTVDAISEGSGFTCSVGPPVETEEFD